MVDQDSRKPSPMTPDTDPEEPEDTVAPAPHPAGGQDRSPAASGDRHAGLVPDLAPLLLRWRSRFVTAVLVTLVILTSVALRSTSSDVADREQAAAAGKTEIEGARSDLAVASSDLAAERHQLGSTIEGLTRSEEQLKAKTAERDSQAATAEQTRVELFNLRASLNSQAARLYVQNKLLGDLQACLRAADQALNALSHGDTKLGGLILDDAKSSCETVNNYLAEQGLTT